MEGTLQIHHVYSMLKPWNVLEQVDVMDKNEDDPLPSSVIPLLCYSYFVNVCKRQPIEKNYHEVVASYLHLRLKLWSCS